MTLSAFLRQAALEKSDDVLKSKDALTLSDRDRDLFLDALENPPKPNKRLKQAFSIYHKQKSNIGTDLSSKTKSKSRIKKTTVKAR